MSEETETADQRRDRRLREENEERWWQKLRADPPPDLQELVVRHGGYDKITPETWAEYDRVMMAWKARRRLSEPMLNAAHMGKRHTLAERGALTPGAQQ